MGFLIVTVSHFCFYLKGITGFEGFFFAVVVVTLLPNLLLDFYDRDHLE